MVMHLHIEMKFLYKTWMVNNSNATKFLKTKERGKKDGKFLETGER